MQLAEALVFLALFNGGPQVKLYLLLPGTLFLQLSSFDDLRVFFLLPTVALGAFLLEIVVAILVRFMLVLGAGNMLGGFALVRLARGGVGAIRMAGIPACTNCGCVFCGGADRVKIIFAGAIRLTIIFTSAIRLTIIFTGAIRLKILLGSADLLDGSSFRRRLGLAFLAVVGGNGKAPRRL